jgi:proteic killer suppression protein
MPDVIRNFKHKGLQRFYLSGDTRSITGSHAKRILIRLDRLNRINNLEELPTEWKCHALHRELEGFHAIWLTGAWRIIFRFEDGEFCDIDYLQYHG